MKLSFSLSSSGAPAKASSRRAKTALPSDPDAEDFVSSTSAPQFVTEFDPSQTLASSGSAAPRVIAPIPTADFFRNLATRKKPPSLPDPAANDVPSDPATSFVLDTSSSSASSTTRYGLTVRGKPISPSKSTEEYLPPRPAASSTAVDPVERFKEDIQNVPEDRGLDEFRDTPLEGFGAALLAGYGWTEGRGIGRNNQNGDTPIFTLKRRGDSGSAGRETTGLGYNPGASDPKKRHGEWVHRDSHDRAHANTKDSNGSGASSNEVQWLARHIRVKVVSEKLKGGKYYLKKGTVVGIAGPKQCDVVMDEGRELVQGLEQRMLQTALPRRGGPVLVLLGKHKGVYGRMLERDRDRDTAIVRDDESHNVFNVDLDHIAEFVGDPAELVD